jgi:RimJ/RimL family protein N-acetyltransferase
MSESHAEQDAESIERTGREDHGLCLRKFDPRIDVEPLFAAYSNPTEQALFSPRIAISSLADFDAWLGDRMTNFYHDFSVIEQVAETQDGDADAGRTFAGCVYSYNYSDVDQRCNVFLYLAPRWRSTGAGGRIAATFIDELFTYYPLRKVYLYVYDYNRESLTSDLQAGFVEEGLLRDWRYFDGRWWDCHVLAMTREAFGRHLARFSLLSVPGRGMRGIEETGASGMPEDCGGSQHFSCDKDSGQ